MTVLKTLLRISLLLIMVVLGFTIIMPGWYHNLGIIGDEVTNRFLSNEQLREKESQQHKQNNMESEARLTGQSVEDIRKREYDSQVRWQRFKKLEELAKTNQAEALSGLLSTTPENGLPNELFQAAIESNSREAFDVLLASDIDCAYTAAHGYRAFEHAIRAQDAHFFKSLIENGCSLEHDKYHKPLTIKILQSRKHSLLLEFPISDHCCPVNFHNSKN